MRSHHLPSVMPLLIVIVLLSSMTAFADSQFKLQAPRQTGDVIAFENDDASLVWIDRNGALRTASVDANGEITKGEAKQRDLDCLALASAAKVALCKDIATDDLLVLDYGTNTVISRCAYRVKAGSFVRMVSISGHGKSVVLVDDSGHAVCLSMERNGQEISSFDIGERAEIMRIDTRGRALLVGRWGLPFISLYDLPAGRELASSSDTELFVSVGAVFVEECRFLVNRGVLGPQYGPPRLLASVSLEGSVRIAESNPPLISVIHTDKANKYLFTGSLKGELYRVPIDRWSEMERVGATASQSPLIGIAVSSNGKRAAVLSNGDDISVFEISR